MTATPSSLTPVFLDTAYVYALVNTRDEWHQQAVRWQQRLANEQRPLVTTQLILVEIADGLAAVRFRFQAAQIIAALESSPFVEVVTFMPQLFYEALQIYRQHQDKDWGLTDCASFVVMRQQGLQDALTVDEHFRQAGFRALLREA